MQKLLLAASLLVSFFLKAQTNNKLEAYAQETAYNNQKQLNYLKFKESHQIKEGEVAEFINLMVLNNSANKVSVLKTEKDALGFTTTKYSILLKGTPVFNKVIVAHVQNGKLISLNGDLQEVNLQQINFLSAKKTL